MNIGFESVVKYLKLKHFIQTYLISNSTFTGGRNLLDKLWKYRPVFAWDGTLKGLSYEISCCVFWCHSIDLKFLHIFAFIISFSCRTVRFSWLGV
jgi:hypothetical protein